MTATFGRTSKRCATSSCQRPPGAQVPLGQLARIEVVRGPMGIKSEGAVPNAWIYVDVKNIDVGTYVQTAQRAVNDAIARGAIRLPSRL